MRCLVVLPLLLVCAGVGHAAVASSCALPEEYFARNNVTADDSDVAGVTCGGQCCGRGREGSLKSALRQRVGGRAAAATRPIAELLLSTRRTLQDHLIGLSQQSQNKTAVFFMQMYKSHATRAHGPLSVLYDDIRSLLRTTSERNVESGEDMGSKPPKDLSVSSRKFFRDVFPVVYHNVLKLNNKQFTPEYEACLRDAYDAAQPFGDVPQQFGKSLTRALEAARVLLHVLAFGAGTLAASEQILTRTENPTCSTLLLKASGCGFCKGHDGRPCRNYCLNVARGCVGSLVSELDAPWSGYVEGVERLSRSNDADQILRDLDTKVSEAIINAMEGQLVLEKKVRQECGPPSTVSSPEAPSSHVSSLSRRDSLRAPPPDTELLQFAASLSASKKLFASVADRLCDEPDFAQDGNERCWNGETIGEYTKVLVPSTSVIDQKYNPEMAGGAPQDPEVAELGDKLRQARQLMSSYMNTGFLLPPDAMQGDEAGEEQSGSGRDYDDDGSYDTEGSGEGSGSRSTEGRILTGETPVDTTVPRHSSAPTSATSLALSLILAVTLQSLT